MAKSKKKTHTFQVRYYYDHFKYHVITLTSFRTKQAACRAAFSYWIREGLIKQQPKSSNDWQSSWENVEVH